MKPSRADTKAYKAYQAEYRKKHKKRPAQFRKRDKFRDKDNTVGDLLELWAKETRYLHHSAGARHPHLTASSR